MKSKFVLLFVVVLAACLTQFASDIYARYKRLKGYNVLHPMGYDAFGLPAEQYALDTGQHPTITTAKNIETFHKQLDNIGFCVEYVLTHNSFRGTP